MTGAGPVVAPRRRHRPITMAITMAMGALFALVSLMAPLSGPSGAAGETATVPSPAPLDTAWTTTQGSWLVVPMGRIGDPLNTFWELFHRAAGASRWSLVTPPGVADNGGLVAGAVGSTVSVGFEPSQLLRYSPLARSSDDGASWVPGVLPGALAAVPDALAANPSGGALALSRGGGGAVFRSGGSLDGWHRIATEASVAGAVGGTCRVVALRAVAVADGSPEIGAGCTTPGVVGVLRLANGAWQLDGPRLPGSAAHLPATVLRLQAGPGGTSGLARAGIGRSSEVFAFWRNGPGSPWSLSAPLPLAGTLEATGFGPGQGVVVVTTDGRRRRVAAVAGPGASWSDLPDPPYRTAAVVVGAAGSFDALVVDGATLTDWQLVGGSGRWTKGPSLAVPLQYGSSD